MLKRKSKRVLSIVLAVAMIVGLFPVAAFAEEAKPAAATSLPAANNGTITLNEDITLSSTATINSDTTINLNGRTITFEGETPALEVKSGVLTIQDTSEGMTGSITAEKIAIDVDAGASLVLESGTLKSDSNYVVVDNYGTVTMNGGAISTEQGQGIRNKSPRQTDPSSTAVVTCNMNGGSISAVWGITLFGPGVSADGRVDNNAVVLNMTKGTINADIGISTNASNGANAGCTINMTGGTVAGIEDGTGMYLPAIGITNISGGTVTGDQGIRICAGKLNITGGTIQGTALSDDSDLIAGGNGGTNGAIVVGKASGGYVGDIDVNISGGARVINTAEKTDEDAVAPAIVVSDKNMTDSSMGYDDLAINVNINAAVEGDVVKIPNLTQGTTTHDGGNTNLNLDGSTVTGNVINQSGSNMSVYNTTVTGKVSNSSNGSIIINNSNVAGAVTNTGKNGNLAVLDSNVGSKDENVTMVNSTVNGAPSADTATGKVEAFIGATPYETLEDAIKAAEDGDVVTLVKNAVVDATGKGNNDGILSIQGKNITINGNGKTITAEKVSGTPSMINVQDGANVTINNLILDGAVDGKAAVKHGVNIYQATATLNNVTVKNHTGYASVVNGSSLTVNGLTTSNNGWGGINVEGKAGKADLVVNDATITEQNSIKFEQSGDSAGAVSATINAGDFEYITTGTGVKLDMVVKGGTFATGEFAGAVNIADYVDDGLEFNPVTGQVYKEPEYTGKYSYEIFTKVGENGTISVDRYATEGDDVTITVSPDEAYLLDELAVTAGGKEVEVKDNGDGTYTFKMPSADAKIVVTFAEDPDWEPAPEMPFTDVNEGDWFYDVVLYAYDNGLMTGVSATEFAPNQTTTRGMIVSMLARLEGVTSAESAGFTDVAESDWYATAVNWAASVGVVNGYEDDTFRPNAPITREQMAAILYNYADYKGYDVSARADLSDYADAADVSSWAEDVLAWANAEGLINGMTATTIDPQGATTRAQTAAMFERFLTAHEA